MVFAVAQDKNSCFFSDVHFPIRILRSKLLQQLIVLLICIKNGCHLAFYSGHALNNFAIYQVVTTDQRIF